MSIELAEKIKALARIALEAQSITKDMKKAFEMRSDSLEARIAVLEKFTKPSEPIEYAKYIPSVTAGDPEKRGRGRPKKV